MKRRKVAYVSSVEQPIGAPWWRFRMPAGEYNASYYCYYQTRAWVLVPKPLSFGKTRVTHTALGRHAPGRRTRYLPPAQDATFCFT